MKVLEIILVNYKKSNDEKYLTEIKNITGSSISDKNLADLTLKDKEVFVKEMKQLFEDKRASRIKILGEEQNKNLEKKIFLQIIDFSWRSHLNTWSN